MAEISTMERFGIVLVGIIFSGAGVFSLVMGVKFILLATDVSK